MVDKLPQHENYGCFIFTRQELRRKILKWTWDVRDALNHDADWALRPLDSAKIREINECICHVDTTIYRQRLLGIGE
eukprot:Pgem_evm1s12013